jgi:nitrogen fixation protein NifQ
MTAEELYGRLMGIRPPPSADAFDRHVLASILAIGFGEVGGAAATLGQAVGLDAADLSGLIDAWFPGAGEWLATVMGPAPARSDDESCLVELLTRGGTAGSPFETPLACMIARRAQRANHLWQDLGLRNRDELSRLMLTHFAPLARLNRRDMKWKKFFYRLMCRDAGYGLCTAPSCGECADFSACFGEEAGASLLIHARLEHEKPELD